MGGNNFVGYGQFVEKGPELIERFFWYRIFPPVDDRGMQVVMDRKPSPANTQDKTEGEGVLAAGNRYNNLVSLPNHGKAVYPSSGLFNDPFTPWRHFP